MTFLLLAAGQVPGSWSSSKPAGQQGWEWLKWEEGGGPRIRKVGGLDQEGGEPGPGRWGALDQEGEGPGPGK